MILNYKTMFAAATAVLVSGSVMAQSADLTMKWKAGHQYTIQQSIGLDMTMPNPQGDGDIATKMNMAIGMQGPSAKDEKGTIVDMNFDTISMKMVMGGNEIMNYDSTKPYPESPMGKAMAPLLELKFKTLYAKDGKFVELKDFDEKMLTPEMGFTKDSLESVMKQQSQMIPHREVKVGEIWEANLIAPMQGFEYGLSCNYDFKLSSVKEVEGKQIARIDFTADMEKVKVKKNGIDMVLSAKNIEGYYLFDVKDGQFTESKAFFDMVAEVQGVEMIMQMKMKIGFGNSPLKK
ncbi:MAG: hypothetical protein ACI9E1_000681 [Cryomorphaceae bacterium]|jgi:hypothetical protein